MGIGKIAEEYLGVEREEILDRVKVEKARQDELHNKATGHFIEATKAMVSGNQDKFDEEQKLFDNTSKEWVQNEAQDGLSAESKEKIIDELADAEEAFKKAKAARDVVREKIKALFEVYEMDSFSGSRGTVKVISKKGSRLFSKDIAKKYMSEEDYESCFYIGKGSSEVKFKPAK